MNTVPEDFSLSPAIPQLPSGDLVVTRDFYAQRLGFEHFRVFEAQGFLIAIRQAVDVPPAIDWTLICSSCGLADGIRLPGFKG